MSILLIHERLAFAAIYYLAIVGIWGAYVGVPAWWRRESERPLSSNYRGALLIAEVIVLIQALAGITLVLLGHQPRSVLHFLYGVLAAVVLPVAFSYVEGRRRDGLPTRDWLVFGLATLVAFGLAIRSTTT